MRKITVVSLIILFTLLTGCGAESTAPDISVSPTGTGEPPSGSVTVAPGTNESITEPDEAQGDIPVQPTDFAFVVKGVSIHMGGLAAPVVEALGEPQNYFEAPSCAFEGVDKIFYYSGFELFTYPVDGDDFISSINLTDDSVTTFEGVYLGLTFDDMIAAYGEDHDRNFGQYTYILGDSLLSFLIEDDVITVITYNYANMPEQ